VSALVFCGGLLIRQAFLLAVEDRPVGGDLTDGFQFGLAVRLDLLTL
jgi:hypothetical protein